MEILREKILQFEGYKVFEPCPSEVGRGSSRQIYRNGNVKFNVRQTGDRVR